MVSRTWGSSSTTKTRSLASASLLVWALLSTASAQAQVSPGQVPEAQEQGPLTDTSQGFNDGTVAVDGADADPTAVAKERPGSAPIGVAGFRRGPGFALTEDGRSRFHVGADAAMGFDTNPYSQPFQLMLQQFSGDAVVRVRPNAEINYPGSLIAFDAQASLDYGFLPGLLNPGGRNFLLTRGNLGAGLEINRGGMFSVAVRDELSAGIDPGFVTVGSTFTRVRNNLVGGVGFRPGGGTLMFKVEGNFLFEKYFDFLSDIGLNSPSPIQTELLDNMGFGISGRVDWRFLPKSGLFAEAGVGTRFYPFAGQFAAAAPFNFPVFVRGGIMGNFTSKLSGLASIGYANPLTLNPAGIAGIDTLTFIGLIGQLELQYRPFELTQIAGGLMRAVQPVPLYQHVTNNRVYANFSQGIGRSFLVNVNAGYSVLLFGRDLTDPTAPILPVSQSTRLDGHLDADIRLAYFLFDWLSFGVSNRLDWRLSNAVIRQAAVGGGDVNLSFLRNETLLLATVYY
jgi:hypothetical protein